MKKLIIVFMLFMSTCFVGCNIKDEEVVRIHIRANSNSVCDQEIKLVVRDSVVEYITTIIADCDNVMEVKNTLTANLRNIETVADRVLYDNGFNYISSASLNNEYFPSRDYGGVTFPADYYDALIIKLGSGVGNNWWCVAYPPLCFIGENDGSGNVKYRSKLIELINKFFGV